MISTAHVARPRVALSASGRSRASRAHTCVVRAAKTADGPKIAIVGVTGAVGQEFLRVRPRGTVMRPKCRTLTDFEPVSSAVSHCFTPYLAQ